MRSWRKDDLKALLRHANNPKIAANLRDQFPHPYTRRDGIDYLEYAQMQEPETSFAIEYGGEASVALGSRWDATLPASSAEMGYWLSEELLGPGIATRAVTAMSEWAFESYRPDPGFRDGIFAQRGIDPCAGESWLRA